MAIIIIIIIIIIAVVVEVVVKKKRKKTKGNEKEPRGAQCKATKCVNVDTFWPRPASEKPWPVHFLGS